MAGEDGNDELRRFVDHQYCRVFVLAFEVRGDEAHHGAQRDEKDDLAVLGKQGADPLTQGLGLWRGTVAMLPSPAGGRGV